jgi:tellurite methyltransferase
MRRSITGCHQDDVNDWVAELSCGHGQHVRHKPPFFSRPWVVTPEGRASMLGTELDCVRCDRLELPDGLVAYKRTADFDEVTIPSGLRKEHSTKPGVWGVIHVISGRLRYRIDGLGDRELLLDPETRGIVVPEVLHHVDPDGPVRFFVEFRRKGG